MEHISDGILEAAYLTVGDDEDAVAAWIKAFKLVADMRVPEGVRIDLGTCKQKGGSEKIPHGR